MLDSVNLCLHTFNNIYISHCPWYTISSQYGNILNVLIRKSTKWEIYCLPVLFEYIHRNATYMDGHTLFLTN